MEEIRWPCLRKFKVKRDKESDQTGLSDVQLWKHTSHRICSFINLSHGPWPTNPGGGWHSRARGVKNTSSGSRARARVWGRGLRWWHGWRRLCVCACEWVYTRCMCPNACSFMTALGYSEGCGVVEPAVLSIDCYFEAPADGTAVSLGETRPSEISSILRQGRGWRGIRGYLACFFPVCVISFWGSDGNAAQTETCSQDLLQVFFF